MNATFAVESAPHLSSQPGKWVSLALTVVMHGVLALVLFLGVQWQRRPPEPISVELVRSLPPLPAIERPPVKQEPPPPPPKIKEPEPQPEPPKPVKPDLALKQPKPEPIKPIKKEEVKPPPEPVKPKPEPVKAKPSEPVAVESPTPKYEDRLAQLMKQDEDRAKRQSATRATAERKADADDAARLSKATDEWRAKISSKVKSRIVKSQIMRLSGPVARPTAEFEIRLLPSGDLMDDPKLVRSSGNKDVDEAILRAIVGASPLPLPAKSEVFQRELRLVLDPLAP